MNFTEVTKPNRPWLMKMVIFAIALLGFGLYGLYDASVVYPGRGVRHSRFTLFQYLEAAKSDGLSDTKTTVADPVAELKSLEARNPEQLKGADRARYDWLRSLKVIHRLKPEWTKIDRPDSTLTELRKEWTTGSGARNAPKPLSAYDIPVQWLFTAIGLGGGSLLLLHILRITRRKYRWDPQAKALQLADGTTLSPADIEEFDKRKWEKFLIFLKVKAGHSPHGGKELKLDLYQHAPLEAWVLEMERIAFPDREEPKPPEPAAT